MEWHSQSQREWKHFRPPVQPENIPVVFFLGQIFANCPSFLINSKWTQRTWQRSGRQRDTKSSLHTLLHTSMLTSNTHSISCNPVLLAYIISRLLQNGLGLMEYREERSFISSAEQHWAFLVWHQTKTALLQVTNVIGSNSLCYRPLYLLFLESNSEQQEFKTASK